jgi:hypothetical protein
MFRTFLLRMYEKPDISATSLDIKKRISINAAS